MLSAVCAVCLCAGMILPAHAAEGFSDVDSGAWYVQAVAEVSQNGYMTGTGDGIFSPDAPVTRATVAAVLWRLEGAPGGGAESPFPDVAQGTWYERPIAWAKSCGIAAGSDKGLFNPDAAVTRQELAVFLYRYAQYRGETPAEGVLGLYPDTASVSAWALEGMGHAVGAGLITGTDEGRLNPGGAASRAQLAVILVRLMTPAMG